MPIFAAFRDRARQALPWRAVLSAVEQLRKDLAKMGDTLAGELEGLKQRVEQLTSVDQAAAALLTGLHNQLEAALQGASSSGATAEQLQELNLLSQQIATATQGLAAAVAANTSAAPSSGADAGASGASGAPGAGGGDTNGGGAAPPAG